MPIPCLCACLYYLPLPACLELLHLRILFLALFYPEDSLNWHCDYRYIANRKKYSQAGEVGE